MRGRTLRIAGRNNKQVAGLRDLHLLIYSGDGTQGRGITMRDGVQSLTREHSMDAPCSAMAGRDGVESVPHRCRGPWRHPQLISSRSYGLQQGRIEILDFRNRA